MGHCLTYHYDPQRSGPTVGPSGTRQDQRGALNLVGGRVYAAFADFFVNEKGAYPGWVVGC